MDNSRKPSRLGSVLCAPWYGAGRWGGGGMSLPVMLVVMVLAAVVVWWCTCKGTVHFQHRLRHGVASPAVAAQHRLRHGHATPAVAAQLRLHLQITSSSSASLRSLSLPTVQSFLTHT